MNQNTIKKIAFVFIFSLLFGTRAFAETNTSQVPTQEDSIYKYSALENKLSIDELQTNAYLVAVAEGAQATTNTNTNTDQTTKQLLDTTEKANFSIESIENAITTVKNQNLVRTFLIGNNLGVLKFQLAQIKDQALFLNKLAAETDDESIQAKISAQLTVLNDERKKVEGFIHDQESRVSLLGWFVNLL